MISIPDILSVDDINLTLSSDLKSAAVQEVLFLLDGDPRILNFEALCHAVESRNAAAIAVPGAGICIAHGRTDAVSHLVLAVGRSDIGILCPEIQEPVNLLFTAGIPTTLDSEYLRIVGALVRACGDPEILPVLLETQDPREFLDQLSSVEIRL